MVNGSLISRPY